MHRFNVTLEDYEYIKLDRDKSTFKSHRDFSSEKEITLNTCRVNFSYLFVTVFLEGIGRK